MADTTYSQSADILNAVKTLEELERAGTIRPAEQAALDKYRKKTGAATKEVARTSALYRGMQAGVTLNYADELGGAISAATGGDYANARDAIRRKDMAAELVAPEEFARGRVAGGVAGMALPSVGVMKYTAGMGPIAKALYGGAAGGILGGLSGMGAGETMGERLQNARLPAAVGAGVGLLAPLIGYAGGKITRGIQDKFRKVPGFGSSATQTMAGALNRSQAAGQDIAGFLDDLGPEGMLADIPGNPRRVAQGLAAIPGEGGELLGNAIERRAVDASGRIKAAADDAISAPNAAFEGRRALAVERASTLGPEYDAALAVIDPIDVSGIGARVNELREDAVGEVASAIAKIEKELGGKVDEAGNLTFEGISALRLHNLRSELSDDISAAVKNGRTKFVAQMSPVLRAIDSELDALPGYAAARTGYANNKAMERAIEEGRTVFRGGEASALSPNELRAQIQKFSPEQLDAFRKGAREYIAALMGTSKNDAAAAWGAFAKEWNEEKLRIILGKAEADKLVNRLKAENIFSQTRGDVLKGSQTQMRAEAAAALGDFRLPDTGQRPGPVKRVMTAMNEAGNAAIDSVMYGGRTKANLELGKLLAMQGPERDKLLPLLLGEAARKNKDTKTQKAIAGLLDLALRSSAPAIAPLVVGNPQ